jgi:hypothetical protein
MLTHTAEPKSEELKLCKYCRRLAMIPKGDMFCSQQCGLAHASAPVAQRP